MKAKTRQEVATEYGICRKTLYNWMKQKGVLLNKGLLYPKELDKIYRVFGRPDQRQDQPDTET